MDIRTEAFELMVKAKALKEESRMQARFRRLDPQDVIPLCDGIHPPSEKISEPNWIELTPEEYKRMFSCANVATETANYAEDTGSSNSRSQSLRSILTKLLGQMCFH